MAVMLEIVGTYKVESHVSGKRDVKEFKIHKPWPIEIADEDFEEMQTANFYIKSFLIDGWLRSHPEIKEEYYGLRSCGVESVERLTDAEIDELVGKGELLAIDPDDITAEDINSMKRTEMIMTVVMMNGDKTNYMARTKSLWQGRDNIEMRSNLKAFMGLSDAVEEVKVKEEKRTSRLLGKKEDKPKATRAPRKRTATKEPTLNVSVSE